MIRTEILADIQKHMGKDALFEGCHLLLRTLVPKIQNALDYQKVLPFQKCLEKIMMSCYVRDFQDGAYVLNVYTTFYMSN